MDIYKIKAKENEWGGAELYIPSELFKNLNFIFAVVGCCPWSQIETMRNTYIRLITMNNNYNEEQC